MKELLRQYAAYNLWANQKLCDLIMTLPADLQTKELPSSFSSVHLTLLHMWDSESVWWQRMKLQEVITVPSSLFPGSTLDAAQGLLQQNKLWDEWIQGATEMTLEHVFSYYSTKRELFKQPTFQVFLHVMNHGTYHRGQLVNMLRQLGQQKIPQTDFIVWTRKRN